MQLNFATTLSFCAAATTSWLAALGAFLSRHRATRHFRYAAAAMLSGALYCLSDAVLAGSMSDAWTIWAGRLGVFSMCAHSAGWVVFLAAWAGRPLSLVERAVVGADLLAAVLGLVPGLIAANTIHERRIE